MRRSPGSIFVVGVLMTGAAAAAQTTTSSAASAPATSTATPATAARTDWPLPGGDYEDTRYSALDQINTRNAAQLRVAWTFDTGVDRGHEAAPIVANGVMYVVTPYPNILYAIDLKNPNRPRWKYEPKPAAAAQGVACCDTVNRGAIYADGKVFITTLDGHVAAVDASRGAELWKVLLGDINKGETITMSPLVVRGKVYVGNSGGEMGVRGWLTALDAKDGHILWRAWSTGPDADVRIGPRFKPYYAQDRGKDLGVTSWPPDHWKIGGGTVWGFVSYDPESNLIFHGTANPGVWNPELRPGDNKWTCGVFARDADTGEAVWFYQYSPHDLYDHDGVNENMVLTLPIGGSARRVLVHPDRNGYVYVHDRLSGQVLSATPFARVNSSKGVDLQSGRLIPNPDKEPKTGKVVRDISPISAGAKDWSPTAYSPRTGWLYMPHHNMAMDYEGVEANYIAGTPYLGVNVKTYPIEGQSRGEFCAWDLVNARKVWKIDERFPCWSGAIVTAGDVVFYGTMDRWFKAVNARTGELLWKFQAGSGIIGQPTTFLGPDGRQYVAILAGVGGWAGAIVAGDLDPRDPTGALGFVGGMTDLPQYTSKGGTLYVFSLP